MTDLGQQYCSQLQRRGMPRGSKVGGGQKGENVGRTSIEASRHRSSARRGVLGQSPYTYQNKTFAANWIWRCAPVCDWKAARETAPNELLAALSLGRKKFG